METVLDILIELARHGRGETITYGDLVKQLGIRTRDPYAGRVIALHLNRVAFYCLGAGVPPLTVLVVDKKTGKPSGAFKALFPDVDAAKMAVDCHDWENSPPPPFPRQSSE